MPSRLPTERLVLTFGVGIAGCTYGYWAWRGVRLGVPWVGVATPRATIVLAAFLLLAVILRMATRLSTRDEEP